MTCAPQLGSGQRTHPSVISSPEESVTCPRWMYTRLLRRDVHVDRLPLREELARRFALLARAGGALLHAPEWDVELEPGTLLVDFDHAAADVPGEAECFAEVTREEGGGQA